MDGPLTITARDVKPGRSETFADGLCELNEKLNSLTCRIKRKADDLLGQEPSPDPSLEKGSDHECGVYERVAHQLSTLSEHISDLESQLQRVESL